MSTKTDNELQRVGEAIAENAVLPMAPLEDGGVIEADESAYYSEESATLGDRVAAARQQAGLTQSGLASRLGVSKKVVSSWENDRSEPRANRLQMLAGMLNVTVSWLLTGSGDGVEPAEAAEPEHVAQVSITLVVTDLQSARAFVGDQLGCRLERQSETEHEFNFFGQRLSLVEDPDRAATPAMKMVEVDGSPMPSPNLGVVLPWETWRALAERLRSHGVDFAIEPTIRDVGAPGEHGVFCLNALGGLALVFKAGGAQAEIAAAA